MNTFRVGLVGCGLNSENHLMAFSNIKGVKPVAVCDTNSARAKEKASRYGIKQVFTDFDSMLKLDLDLVDIVTPTPSHAPLSQLALEAGIDTLVEKPMAISSKECLDMIRAAKKSGRTLSVVHNKLFFDSVSQTKKPIEDEQLSVSRMRVSHYYAHAPFMEKWRLKEESGGLLWDALVHHVYLTEYFLGGVQSVYAIAKKVKEQTFDSFTLILQNGKKVSVCEFAWNVYEPLLEFQVLTEEGIRFHSDLIHDFLIKRKRSYRTREVEAIRSFTDDLYIPMIKWTGHLQKLLEIRSYPGAFPFKRTFFKLIKHLISYLKGASNSPPITADNGFQTIRVLEAAEKSIKTMRVQSLPK